MPGIVEALRSEQFINSAVQYAVGRNPDLSRFAPKRVRDLVITGAFEIAAFEEIARTSLLRTPKTPEQARKIVVIWDVSAMGTYLKEFQDDRWKNTPWAGWTDRRRLNYSGALMRKLTGVITGESYQTPLGVEPVAEQIAKLRSAIEKVGPHLIYGSTTEQNQDVEKVLKMPGIIIPRTKVHIIDDPEKSVGINTINQMKSFSLPPDVQILEGEILALVAHAPHMMRALHFADKYKPFPEGLIIQPYPLASSHSAGTDYAKQEISGLLYYALLTGDASEQSHPYQI